MKRTYVAEIGTIEGWIVFVVELLRAHYLPFL